jgi:hypothetical protein
MAQLGIWWGLGSWTAAAVLVALLVRWLPPWRRGGFLALLAATLLGGWAGGVLATLLGFGGLAGFDPRSLATAGLAALLLALLLALGRTRAQRTRRS